MSSCELCGREGIVSLVIIEGSQLKVCAGCKGFGKEAGENKYSEKKVIITRQTLSETVVLNYSDIVKQAREKLGLNHKDFANLIKEKESAVTQIENGRGLDLELAKRLEKILNIKLIIKEKYDEMASKEKENTGVLTIGDIIKKKNG